MGTLIFSRNYAKGTFIREGTFIRQCIVKKSLGSEQHTKGKAVQVGNLTVRWEMEE